MYVCTYARYYQVLFSLYLKLNNFAEGDDFVSGPYPVSFKRGDTYKYFSIPLIDDKVYEGDEYFTVTLKALPHGIVHAPPYTARVKITDDECK